MDGESGSAASHSSASPQMQMALRRAQSEPSRSAASSLLDALDLSGGEESLRTKEELQTEYLERSTRSNGSIIARTMLCT